MAAEDESPRAVRPGASGWQRRRPRGATPRRHQVNAWFTDAEYQVVLARAAAARLAPAAYVASVVLSERDTGPAAGAADDEDRADRLLHLMRLHRQLRGAAANLNQAVRVLNSTGQPPGELAAIAEHVRRVTTAVDEAIAAVVGRRR